MNKQTVRVEFAGSKDTITFSRSSDGGLLIEQEIFTVAGKPDHLRVRNDLGPVDASRVFALLARDES